MSRYYKHKGFKIPSVTTIIADCSNNNMALIQWAANQTVKWVRENALYNINKNLYAVTDQQLDLARFNFRETSKEALSVGSIVHSMVEKYLKNKPFSKKETNTFETSKSVESAFFSFLDWFKANKVEVIFTEKKVYGDGYAGTLDLKCKLDSIMYVIDFKTSKDIYIDDYGPQVAAYRATQRDCGNSGILRLDKETGIPDWRDTSNRHERDLDTFMKMRNLFYAKHPRIKKNAGIK